MDFMKLIKSLEALLYEVMSWLVFYPRTLWLALTRPLYLMRYADTELGDSDEERYSDTLSPPIFLALTLGIAHLIELTHGWEQLDGISADDRNLLAFRLVAFALIPLMLSLRMLRLGDAQLDRKTLRPPFYAQCFVAAPFALMLDLAAIFRDTSPVFSVVLAAVAFAWLLTVETLWFRRDAKLPVGKAIWNAVRAIVTALFVIILLSVGIDLVSHAS